MTKNEIGYFLTSIGETFNNETTLEPVAQIILTSNECLYCDGRTTFTFNLIETEDGSEDGYLDAVHTWSRPDVKISGGGRIIIPFFELVGFQMANETQRKDAYIYGGSN